MKLVESEIDGPGRIGEDAEKATPPRPEHRRVSVSLLFTASVLVGITAAIYLLFPERHNLLLTRSIELHRDPPAFQLERPSQALLGKWGASILGRSNRDVSWPSLDTHGGQVAALGAAPISILKRPAALVRYRVDGSEMTMVVQRARDVPPRTHRRTDGAEQVISWRKGPWTFVAVGNATDS